MVEVRPFVYRYLFVLETNNDCEHPEKQSNIL